MPLPLTIDCAEISRAVETALVKEKVIPERQEAVQGLRQ